MGAFVPRRSQAPCGGSAPGGFLVDAHGTISQSARSGSTTRATTPRTGTPRTSTKGRRLRLRAEGRRSCRSSRVAPAGAPAPRRHGPVNPRRVASLRPRAASGPRRTAAARRPSARLGLTRISCVPRGSAARGRPLRPPGPQAARPPNKLRRPRRRRKAAKARTRKRAFASTKAWPRRPRAMKRPSCQAALRAPTARAMKAWHGAMPPRGRPHAPRHAVDEEDRDEKRRPERTAVACGSGRVQGLTAAARLASRALDPARSSARPLLSGRWRAISPRGETTRNTRRRTGARPKARPVVQIKQYTSVDTAQSGPAPSGPSGLGPERTRVSEGGTVRSSRQQHPPRRPPRRTRDPAQGGSRKPTAGSKRRSLPTRGPRASRC